MIIGINASFLRKQNTGIGQVSINFLRKLIDLEIKKSKIHKARKGNMEFILYLEDDVRLKLPKNFSKRISLPLYKRDDLIRKIWWEKYLLPKLAKKDGCDIFISLYQCPTIMPKMLPHIMVAHDIIPKLFPQYLNNSRKKMYQNLSEKGLIAANKIIAVSHRTEKDLITHLGIEAKKITVSYIDVDEIYKKAVTEKESQKVLKKYKIEKGYIYNGGGLEVRKNTENLLKAYRNLFDKYGMTGKIPKLVVSGKLMPELAPLVCDVEKVVKELKLTKHVVILNHVPQKDLPALYSNASLFVYPSLYEGFGLPVLEAMSQGTPVVTSKTSSLPEVGSDSVLYCDPLNVDDLVMAMKNVLLNDHMKAALSMKGQERSKHFSWKKFTQKMMNIALGF
jgi:glycosyltransferase involved in cell wall biosynthesis